MPWIEPLNYPTRDIDYLPYNPGIPDRQLWAIGMIAAQWAMIEMQMHSHMRRFTENDKVLADEYAKQQTFKHQREFWQAQVERKVTYEPRRTELLAIIARIKVSKDQRDRVMHGSWGGGMQAGTWSSENYSTGDAKLLKGMHPGGGPSWRLDFQGLRKIAREMARINSRMFTAFLDPSIHPY